MINNLYNLYKKSSRNTPLEDFTTESFVGILKLHEDLLLDFSINFLGLNPGNFEIKTQVKFSLPNDPNCIIDIVIENDEQICFIENKVNSKEGLEQLSRYSQVLDQFKIEGKQTFLYYCTKKYEKKEIQSHNFKQFRWFQIAKFLQKSNCKSLIIDDFLIFLKQRKMSQDLTISSKDTFVMENLFDTIELIDGHLNRVKPLFIDTFNKNSKVSDGFSTSQILKHKRLIYFFKEVLGNEHWSEIKYGFQLNTSQIYCGIWISKNHSKYNLFKDHIESNYYEIIKIDKPNGFGIELKESLGLFLNDENGDDKILNWYKKSFLKIRSIISDTEHLGWTINL